MWTMLGQRVYWVNILTFMGLHRNTTNRMLGGVCSGLGDYFLLGGTFFRILFFIGTFLSFGYLLLLYLFLWVILSKNEPSWMDDGSSDGTFEWLTEIYKEEIKTNQKQKEVNTDNDDWDQDQFF